MNEQQNSAHARSGNCLPFRLGRVSVGLSNLDYSSRPNLGEVEVRTEAFVFPCFVRADGTVSLPSMLRDRALETGIAVAARGAVLEELSDRFEAAGRRDRERLRPAEAVRP